MSPSVHAILPELILVGAGCVLVLAEAFVRALRPRFGALAALGVAGALVARWLAPTPGAIWSGAVIVDDLARFVDSYILVALLLACVMAEAYLARTGQRFGEFYALLLWAAAGAMVMAKADHMLVVFVGLELLSISLYVLNAFHRDSAISLEAGWKYLVVGALAGGTLLFGMALMYGATASLQISVLAPTAIGKLAGGDVLTLVALALIVAGLGFKLALVPFHAWAPDVYQGSPTPVTAFLSVVPKGAALVVLARIVAALDPAAITPRWTVLLATLAVASMTLGNLVAIAQRDIKRMLAYSGIAHMGYALVGLVVYGRDGFSGALVYLAAYTFMNIAAFTVVSSFSESEDEPHLLNDLAGAGRRHPFLALALAVSMFSLAGIPPTVGFMGKFLVFRAAVSEQAVWLAVVGVLNSLVSAFYYLRVVYYVYMKPEPKRIPTFTEPWSARLVAGICVLAIVLLGVLPNWLVTAADAAARVLTR